ncbi:MAG: hypothetical protein HQL24_09385 [Candidatus Omnitrophica bacterium]|nr:hypothetical protein [Candidatus Omnitrophota bacterium]
MDIHQGEKTKQVFLFAAHFYSHAIIKEFRKLQAATKDIGDCFILFHQQGSNGVDRRILNVPHYIVNDSALAVLGYKPFSGDSLYPGGTRFPFFVFFRKHRYQYYWFIEYDVKFTGNWKKFFHYFDNAKEDFLTCHIRKHADEPDWSWWDKIFHPTEKVDCSKKIRSFNPICRISDPALSYIDEMQKKGWVGHQEVLIPTLLYDAGFKLRDFGGEGEFVFSQDKGRFYLDSDNSRLKGGTMTFNDHYVSIFKYVRDKLFHPVKPHFLRDGLKRFWQRELKRFS